MHDLKAKLPTTEVLEGQRCLHHPCRSTVEHMVLAVFVEQRCGSIDVSLSLGLPRLIPRLRCRRGARAKLAKHRDDLRTERSDLPRDQIGVIVHGGISLGARSRIRFLSPPTLGLGLVKVVRCSGSDTRAPIPKRHYRS